MQEHILSISVMTQYVPHIYGSNFNRKSFVLGATHIITKWSFFCSPYDNHSHYISGAHNARITETNLKNMEVSLGDSVNLICRSTGKPEPETFWYKVGIQMANQSRYKISKRPCNMFPFSR
jgi:hypothetical protein